MANDISNTADIIDVRDIIERIEELRAEKKPLQDAFDEADAERTELSDKEGEEAGYAAADVKATDAKDALAEWDESEEAAELQTLESLMEDLAGNGGDEKWEGVWYPVTLIHEDHFVDAMKELCEDIGDFPKGTPTYYVIDWDATADNLRADYTSTEYDGATYWYC